MPMEQLVSTEWLSGELDAPDLRLIDATAYLPNDPRDPRAEYEEAHIPGAIFLNLAELIDSDNPVPNMLPPAEKFASRMRHLGVGDGSRIVIYDNSNLHSAARAWWMFKIFGANDIAILNGGMAKWRAEGRKLDNGNVRAASRHFTSWENRESVRCKQDILGNLDSGLELLVDARGADRFDGSTPEPRADIMAGHIPGSRNLPYPHLFHADGTWKQDEELRDSFIAADVDLDRPLVMTCGSGVTAAVLLFGAKLLGKQDVALYDGSWSEWGGDPDTPKATGRA